MSGWSTLRMTILAARRVLPPDLMTPAKASKPFMKLSGPLAVPPPLRPSVEERSGERLVPVPEPHLKSMPSVLARVRIESSESFTELMKQAEHCGLVYPVTPNSTVWVLAIPVPVLRVGVGLDAVAAYVEPDGRVEGGILADEDVDEFIVESCAVFGRVEVALRHTPVADGFGDAGDQLAHAGFALGGAEGAVQIFGGHDVGRGHGPVFGDLDIFLLEDHSALGVGDLSGAQFPFDLVVGRDAGLGEEAAEGQAGGFLLLCRRGGSGGRDGGGGSFGLWHYLCSVLIRLWRYGL